MTLATLDLSSVSDAGSPFVTVVLTGAEGNAITGHAAIYYGALPAAPPSDTLVALEYTWSYLDGGAVPDPEWLKPDFEDSEWKTGRAEFGLGDDDENTEIDGGPEGARYPVLYFRRSSWQSIPSAYSSVRLRVRRDDGAMVYLNGREVFRTNRTDGSIGPETRALTARGMRMG